MNVPVYDLKGAKTKNMTAKAFAKDVRKDLIVKVAKVEQASVRQAYGTDPRAGKKTSAHYHGRRGIKHSMMNREMARMKRIHGSGYLHMRARFVPQAVKGIKAHPPKAEKVWEKKINKKERKAAMLSAASATFHRDWVEKRGHNLELVKHVPLVVVDKLEEINEITDFKQVLDNLGLKEELKRLSKKKVRSGKGTMRGRKFKKKRGMLIVINEDKGLIKAARNFPGLEVSEVKALGVDKLAPGCMPGRLCVWTEGAVKSMEEWQ